MQSSERRDGGVRRVFRRRILQTGFAPFDGSHSAGTMSPEADHGRVHRFVRAGLPWLLERTQAKERLHPRPTLPGFRFQRACRITEDCG